MTTIVTTYHLYAAKTGSGEPRSVLTVDTVNNPEEMFIAGDIIDISACYCGVVTIAHDVDAPIADAYESERGNGETR